MWTYDDDQNSKYQHSLINVKQYRESSFFFISSFLFICFLFDFCILSKDRKTDRLNGKRMKKKRKGVSKQKALDREVQVTEYECLHFTPLLMRFTVMFPRVLTPHTKQSTTDG